MKFSYGGQAVIEGVMMRGQRQMAVAVRQPTGEIILKTEPLKAKIYTSPVMKWPLLRGLVMLWDMLVLGIQSLTWSANITAAGLLLPTVILATIDSVEETRVEAVALADTEKVPAEAGEELPGWLLTLTVLFSLSFSIGLFIVLPAFIAGVSNDWFIHDHLISNLFVEGGLRITLLIGYLWLVGFMPDMRRVFQYHGAEHKAVNAYEAGAPLTTASVQSFTTVHTRCGTNFLLLVIVFAIVIFSFLFTLLGNPPMWLTLPMRIVLVPLVAAIAYEYIKWSAAHYSNPLVRMLMKPGLTLQKLTTRQPDNTMAEVAIVALERVLLADEKVTQSHWDEQRRRLPVFPAQPEPARGESSVAA